jgi:acetyl esterase/lipase
MRTESTKPNPLKSALSKAVGKIRADDDMLEVLNAFASLDPDAIEKIDAGAARRNPTPADAVKRVLEEQGRPTDPQALVPGVRTQDFTIPASPEPLEARVYLPEGNGPFPVVLYFHGGGWVLANKDVYDGGARALAKASDAAVVSVDYRLAPEHPFPAAWDDALAAYRWVLGNPAKVNGDGGRIALAGESAGGNLAVATAIAARDAGLPLPEHVVAVYPVTQTGRDTESYIENAIAVPLNREMMKWFFEHVVRGPDDLQDVRLCLVDAALKGLPPVTIINARIDPLRSDGAMLEDALRDAGVDVERRDYEGVVHEFFGMGAVVAKAREAVLFAAERLRASRLGATIAPTAQTVARNLQ